MTNHSPPPLLVFTDLDGTLLDHTTYSHAPALPALARLSKLDVPVIPTTSKTFAELAVLMPTLNLHDPFIVENGAGVAFPQSSPLLAGVDPAIATVARGGWVLVSMEPRYAQLQTTLAELKACFKFSLFSDLSLQSIAALTGLSEADAARAAERNFSQPIHWEDSGQAMMDFSSALSQVGFRVVHGGRFLHVLGEASKGSSVTWLASLYEKLTGVPIPTVGLGDGGNDVPMLEVVDYPVLIASNDHAPPVADHIARLRVTEQVGPAGWNAAILDILREAGFAGAGVKETHTTMENN